MRWAIPSSLLVAGAHAHGVILMTKGANGVNAPGSCVLDDTPRDCIVNSCGAQADTGIIRDAEINRGEYGPLGWTQGGGNCKPDAVIGQYMGLSTAPKYTGGRTFTGKLDPIEEEDKKQRRADHDLHLDALFSKRASPSFNPFALPIIGFLGLGGNRTAYFQETIVSDYAGKGKDNGLPTTDDDNTISCVYRQINEDGPGPLSAAVDSTSAATDRNAFKDAKVVQNVPGDGFVGLSLATNTNFPVKVQLPEGTVCEGKVAGLDNVCFVRLRNNAFAGPFGGAGFFTQSDKAKKRALEYRRRKRAEASDMETARGS